MITNICAISWFYHKFGLITYLLTELTYLRGVNSTSYL